MPDLWHDTREKGAEAMRAQSSRSRPRKFEFKGLLKNRGRGRGRGRRRGRAGFTRLALVLAMGALAGCAQVDPTPAFRDLANTVHVRTGKRVQWNRGSAQDAEAQAALT